MRVTSEDWKNDWIGIDIGLSSKDIDYLIAMLNVIKKDPDQHFHISSDYKEKTGVGEVTFYVKTAEEKDNMELLGQALAPGTEIPD